jgi:hypothetical protein
VTEGDLGLGGSRCRNGADQPDAKEADPYASAEEEPPHVPEDRHRQMQLQGIRSF